MGKIDSYHTIVTKTLSSYVEVEDEGETQAIFDEERGHYQVVYVGWRKGWYRNYGTLLHVDIKDGKIWIQQDGTEEGIAGAFVERGVPKSNIVLAFYAPYKRQFTEYAEG